MLIDHRNILTRFAENLSWSTHVDIATAWATSNDGLRSLQKHSSSVRVRAVVGLWGNLTEPTALRTLSNIGQLRLVDATRRFHPKVFLFQGSGRFVAWIGSANFTSGGFGMNEEALFETTDAHTVAVWFDRLWERCQPVVDRDIDEYAAFRKRNRPPRTQPPPLPAVAPALTPVQLLQRADHWRGYVRALEDCDRWWCTHYDWSVLGELYSWSETIQGLHDVVVRRNWSTLDDHDRRRMLGLVQGKGWALLGRMRSHAMQTVFGDKVTEIQQIVQGVAGEPESAFPGTAVRAYAQLTDISGIGSGIATRLLTLARPDRFVSLNGASKTGLAHAFGIAPTTLEQPRNYGRLLERIYGKAWHSDPAPIDAREETIRWMRAALLDCFVYKP